MGPTFYDPSHSITVYRKTRIYCNFRLCTRYYFKFYPLLWAATRATHEIFRVKQRGILIAFMFITLIVSQLLTNRHDINNFISNASKGSFWLIYVYIPILFIIVWVKRKWKKSKAN